MKTVLLLIVLLVHSFLSGCAHLGNLLSGGGSADVYLTYIRYPEHSFNHIENIAVFPFEEGRLSNRNMTLWDLLSQNYASNSLALVFADDLTNRLIQTGSFNVFDRDIAQNESSIQMVITGTITHYDVETEVTDNSYTDREGRRRSSFTAKCRGRLQVTYRFIDPSDGRVMNSISVEENYVSESQDANRAVALSKLPDRATVLQKMTANSNEALISGFTPTEITASYAMATIRDDELFRSSLIAARNGNWEEASRIWEQYRQNNKSEAFYNLMLHKRYIQNDLDGAIEHAMLAFEKTADPAFTMWVKKFEKERELKENYYTPLSDTTQMEPEQDDLQ
ncbi:DUF6340 family protein [Chitinispirillales bacterium ANBcel5]|uniref:DUF6340 family protein n=1 Tax=Cellulosispirillum alkaliphilum TaxID=3039283 RepID=UPI002A54A1AB|nr:DUF6340 family protein [Chitinispirillales bacterium ANBcel5]